VVSFQIPQVTACGVAMCAAVGAGIHPSLEVAVRAMRPRAEVVEPDNEKSRQYSRYYDRWMHTSAWLENLIEEVG
jgi:ribulose kinase